MRSIGETGSPVARNSHRKGLVLAHMVTRCVCYGRTFAELKEIAQQCGATTLEQLQQQIEFGLNCKLCHPYVQRMLETGKTEFEVITDDASS